jgi:hypothetical protein
VIHIHTTAHANSYASRGWRVFPLHNPTSHGCSCGRDCGRNIGKHPRIFKWQRCATVNPATIERLWEQWPDANIGIACGWRSQLLVLDVDTKNGKRGDSTLAELCDKHSWKIETFTVRTGSGGRHFYFHQVPAITIASGVDVLGEGLDIRADGGYVVAPPSLHKSGLSYEIKTPGTLQPIPDSILALLNTRPSIRDDGPIYKGQRHKSLFTLACSMRGKGANEAQILKSLLCANHQRCVPPKLAANVETLAHDVVTRYPAGHGGDILNNLYSSGVMATLKPSAAHVFCFIREETARHAEGKVRLTYDEIKKECGIGREAVANAVSCLVDIGLLEKQRTYNQTAGWRDKNAYRLTPESRKFMEYVEKCRASRNFSLTLTNQPIQ